MSIGRTLWKKKFPVVVVVSGSGRLDLSRAAFRTPDIPTVVISTTAGRDLLTRAGAKQLSNVEVVAVDAPGGRIGATTIAQLLYSQFGVRLLLHEGGSVLFGQFLGAGLVQELFLTISPQIAGRRVDAARPGLVEGLAFVPDLAPWFHLITVKHTGDHLFMRYRYSGPHNVVS